MFSLLLVPNQPVGLLSTAKMQATPVSKLYLYSGVDASVLLAHVSEFISQDCQTEPKHAPESLRWKNEVLRH